MALEKHDSTAAMASLASYAEESDSDEEEAKPTSTVDNISDDENDTPTPTPRTNPTPAQIPRPPSSLIADENSKSSDVDPRETKKAKKRKANRLVSYGADEMEDTSSESEEDDEDEISPGGSVTHGQGFVEGKIMNSSLNIEQASSLSRSVLNKSFDEIELPPEPVAKCSKTLQDKIAALLERKQKEGFNLNRNIQNRVDFRNPSIYEKLIEFCGIDEKGTNYPPELYDPSIWGKESYYDALDKAQKADMERREKERKERTKVEFVTATKKAGAKTEIVSIEDKKRKTKWDEPSQATAGRIADSINKTLSANLTSVATGTKSTVIPATGTISKKPSK